ncbi:MAG TPA: PQQ-dependent sugar dehydrogenase [Verrucomicrobiae bacterium]|nr:PQQ-dependent sugar dehydrogenase [Verrucomicrobiae bacterium]
MLTAILALFVGPTAFGQTNGLVAAFGFDEANGTGTIDASGMGNHGVLEGATRTASGKYGGALVFNGSGARVRVTDSASLHLSRGMTLEAWVYPTALGGWRDVIYKGPDDVYYLEGSSGSDPAVGGTFTTALTGPQLPLNTWTHLAGTYDGSTLALYVNGALAGSRAESDTIQQATGALTIGGDDPYGQYFQGRIDEVRIYNRALTVDEIQLDMIRPVGFTDSEPPTVSITSPAAGSTVSHISAVSATASDDSQVWSVEFFADGTSLGTSRSVPYSVPWNTTDLSNSLHTLFAVATDLAGNRATSATVQVSTLNPIFINEVVVPDIVSATTIAFLPDRRMLVGELSETVWVVQPGAHAADATPFLQLNVNGLDGEQGLMDLIVDPDFGTNGFIYIFYTKTSPSGDNYNRVSRFTVSGNTALPGSEFVVWQDNRAAGPEHHGGGIAIGVDGKLYITVGEAFNGPDAQDLTNYRGKLLRVNRDGSIPAGNPFADGAGPNKDEIWALGLRNPFRLSSDRVSGMMFIGDVGGNDSFGSYEEINLVARGANYGWPICEGSCNQPGFTSPLFAYPHAGRDACVTGGFVYRGRQFPAEFYGSYFFGDYVQNWLKRLTFDTNGNLGTVLNFEPPSGAKDGPYGDPVKLIEGPDGAIYYVDIGFNDAHTPNEAAIRRIRYSLTNQPPVALVSATPRSGLRPLQVSFSSAGSFDPEGAPLTYDWTFGDGGSAANANPTHIYQTSGTYTARLRVSDGVNATFSSNLVINVGNPPTAIITSPNDGATFRAGDVISYSGSASDVEDGQLPASRFSWTILFHHDQHIHPAGGPFTNITSGALQIPTSGHDFSGETSYEIILSVIDSEGLRASASVTVFPQKVNLFFDTIPSGLGLDLAGIRKSTPFVQDALIGFNYVVNAPAQTFSGSNYRFAAWSDGGAASHTIVTPAVDASFAATFAAPGSASIRRLPGGGARLHFTGAAGDSWRIEASPDLKNWETIGTATVSGSGSFDFDDMDTGLSHRFYRCVTP